MIGFMNMKTKVGVVAEGERVPCLPGWDKYSGPRTIPPNCIKKK